LHRLDRASAASEITDAIQATDAGAQFTALPGPISICRGCWMSTSALAEPAIDATADARVVAALLGFSKLAGVAVAAVGLLVLAGWALDLPVLTRVLAGWGAMAPNTALAFTLSGASLLAIRSTRRNVLPRLAQILAALVCVIAAATMVEVLWQYDLGIDQALFQDVHGRVLTTHPGRMAPITAVNFLLAGLALLFISGEGAGRRTAAQCLALLIFVDAYVGCAGFMLNVPSLYMLGTYSGVAIHTLTVFLLLSAGLLLCAPDHGLMRPLSSVLAGGAMMRRVLPFALVAPVAVAWLRLQVQAAGLYDPAFGSALSALVFMTLLSGVVWWTGSTANNAHRERRRLTAEKLESKAALHASEQRYRRLFESAQDGILILDGESGVIVDTNPFFTGLLGYQREDLLGHMLWDIGAFMDIEASKNAFAELQSRGYVRHDDLQLKAKDGQLLDVEFISNAYDVAGARVFQCNIRDIRERKRADQKILELNNSLELQVRQRTAQLESAVKDLEGFSYSVSHDLRSPLRAIDNFSGILLEEYAGTLDPEGQRLLGIVRSSATRMDRLITDILAFSRAGRQELKYSSVDMTALAREVFDELRAGDAERSIDLRLAALPPAHADPAAIRQVWVNLLSNAIKFTRGRERAEIEVTGGIENGECRYTVSDNGAGFDPQYGHKLFGVFQRLHTTREFEGTGIGLAIVKRFLDKHGGRAWAESEPGKGAVFHFSLPQREAGTTEGAPS
jgi:PAS domain S-box-containing protein